MIDDLDTLQEIDIQENELEKKKIELVEKFLSDKLQKTEINKTERKVIPILYQLANNPFPISSNKNKNMKRFKIDFLNTYLENYIKLGIPLDRKGRKEEVAIMKSLLSYSDYTEMDLSENKTPFYKR